MALKVSFAIFFCSLSVAFSQPVPELPNGAISGPSIGTNGVNQALARKIASLFDGLPPLTRHYADFKETEEGERIRQDQNYENLLREKVQDKWFAALVGTAPEEVFVIKGRFDTWSGFIDFLQQKAALVEVW